MAFKMKKHPELIEVVKQLRGAVKAHGKQADIVEGHIKEMKGDGPPKRKYAPGQREAIHASKAEQGLTKVSSFSKTRKRKLSAGCKAAAKRKFKVYPSAYANMWASRQQGKGKC
tara:strand:+ start:183 stop:524 length:342 start_codon:yes stop_codon:yes gene_type:complete